MVIVLVQGWSSFSPKFGAVDFVSFYIEIPLMAIMWLGWKCVKKTRFVTYEEMDLVSDVYVVGEDEFREKEGERTARGRVEGVLRWIF